MKSKQTVSQHAPEGHQLKQGTPTMGGLIILVGFLASMPFVHTEPFRPSALPIAILVILFAIIGFVDDYAVPKLMPGKRGLGWKQKILMQVAAAAIPMFMVCGTDWSAIGIGVFVILFFANAYNFSDGLDGLAGTILVAMLCGMIGIIPFMAGHHQIPGLPWGLLGAVLPFLYWNAPKAKVFMGDVGSLPIGAFLGGYWILSTQKLSIRSEIHNEFFYFAIGIWSLMMVAELVPVPLQIASVKLRKKKLFPYTPIHHAFEKAGWPETRVVFVFALAQILFSLLAITLLLITGPGVKPG